MQIPYRILVGGELSQAQIEEVDHIIQEVFYEVDAYFNNWNPSSEVAKLNMLKAHTYTPISETLRYFLKDTDRLVNLTEGRFDPTIATIKKIWQNAQQENREPTNCDLRCLNGVGWENLNFDLDPFSQSNSSFLFWKSDDTTELDLGGIAKGHTVDLLTQRLSFWKNVYVEWGGEIRVKGSHPSGRKWRIGINGGPTLELSDAAIATSGNYYQIWKIQDKEYCHIIDPHLKRPLLCTPASLASVTVIAETCMEADAIATALMLFPTEEKATQWLKDKLPKVQAFFIDNASWHDQFPAFRRAQ